MRLALFASGNGSNVENVAKYFRGHPTIQIVVVFCNNPKAGVIDKMKAFNIPVIIFNKEQFTEPTTFLTLIQEYAPDFLALLGFLWKVPSFLVQQYAGKIINLHPALLPKYGGKGMYGHHVHEAVKLAGDSETGITLHWVNEHYDEGEIINQFKCSVEPNDNIETIAAKIHQLEHMHVPATLEEAMRTAKKRSDAVADNTRK